jgi:hypothetical protein
VRMSKYNILKMIDYLARSTAKSAQLDIDDGAIQRHTRTARFAAGFSATDEAVPQSETRSKSAYYSVIARAVSRLPNNTPEARQALYDRAGVALAAELLDEQNPSVSDAQIVIERLAFERAVRKVEREARKKERPTAHEQTREKHRRPLSSFLSFFQVFKP